MHSNFKGLPDSIAQAKAVVAVSLVYLVQGETGVELAISEINEEICIGCGSCAEICP